MNRLLNRALINLAPCTLLFSLPGWAPGQLAVQNTTPTDRATLSRQQASPFSENVLSTVDREGNAAFRREGIVNLTKTEPSRPPFL